MTMKIKKAIIPVAGMGTRFLPATKAQPKEMLPIVDKPVIQYLVEEAVASGIEEIIFITSIGKRAIEDHFDYSYELMQKLEAKGKKDLMEIVRHVSSLAAFAYVRQPQPLGDGHAVLMARNLVGKNEAVAVLFGDDVVDSKVPCIGQLMEVYEKYGDPVVALMRVPKEEVSRYGVVGSVELGGRVHEIQQFAEKPKVEEAPSNLIVVGKYILTPGVLSMLEDIEPDSGGEIRLAGAFNEWIKTKPLYGCEFEGVRYDCGDKLGYVKATVDYGLKHPEVAKGLREYLKGLKL
ncbi:MAG: UTP--glucose-1-phosphate uridylyltransferase [Parcubacteria group bacterium Gr01-1014_18]|nr:MAG: UTP--glucose-1-phosphate uridylyltransferase [Parcubacteria group bacterium Greene0416_36]TSC81168.1 MAG: UTP--glucose-1-phosphate uridylyltransferase [Parcubacteria group bacterium Gr01-1014_18]TSC99165.1 MAG: UTP--glucose-1-phosphate uridylyltransferase [Parcubacteria group bacterium Greene1014_20]TSD07477.1 MAG: UTP--glucose-1-phosphate uridylyltransferase [Parcubacteria group bacterium Greene0714_2]